MRGWQAFLGKEVAQMHVGSELAMELERRLGFKLTRILEERFERALGVKAEVEVSQPRRESCVGSVRVGIRGLSEKLVAKDARAKWLFDCEVDQLREVAHKTEARCVAHCTHVIMEGEWL